MNVHEAVFLGCLALIVALQAQTNHLPKLDGRGVAPMAVLSERWMESICTGIDLSVGCVPAGELAPD